MLKTNSSTGLLDNGTYSYVFYKSDPAPSVECQPKAGLQMSLFRQSKLVELSEIIEWNEVGKENNEVSLLDK